METQTKKQLLYTVIIILVILNLGTLSFMWYIRLNSTKHEIMQPLPPRSGADFLNSELKFTKEQNEKIERLRDEHFQTVKKIKDEGRELRDLFFSNLSKNDIDSSKINEIANGIAMSEKQVELATFYHMRKIREVCDETQKKKFDEIIQDVLKMGIGPRRGPDGSRPPPPGYRQRDGDGHINPPGVPEREKR
jgi:Spy/CpxP family protein refolding chaperone